MMTKRLNWGKINFSDAILNISTCLVYGDMNYAVLNEIRDAGVVKQIHTTHRWANWKSIEIKDVSSGGGDPFSPEKPLKSGLSLLHKTEKVKILHVYQWTSK